MTQAPLIGKDLESLFASLRNGLQLDPTTFYILLAQVQHRLEGVREWAILRKTDSTKTALPSDTFTTAKALPTDFGFWQTELPLILVDPNNPNDYQDYSEVPFSWNLPYQSNSWGFSVDYANNNLYLLGTVDKVRTINMNYIYLPDDITANTSWVFPARFHAILAYDMAVLYKAGVDYDEVNQIGSKDNLRVREELWESMIAWDTRLQTQMIANLDRFGNQSGFVTGRININR